MTVARAAKFLACRLGDHDSAVGSEEDEEDNEGEESERELTAWASNVPCGVARTIVWISGDNA